MPTSHRLAVSRPRKVIVTALVSALSAALALAPFAVFDTARVSLSSLAYLLLAIAYGPVPALIAGAAAGVATGATSHSLVVGALMPAEALVVALAVARGVLPAIADLAFWLVALPAAVALLSGSGQLSVESIQSMTAAALVRVLVASVGADVLSTTAVVRRLFYGPAATSRRWTLQTQLFYTLLAATALPLLVFGTYEVRRMAREAEVAGRQRVAQDATVVADRLGARLGSDQGAVGLTAAGVVGRNGTLRETPELNAWLDRLLSFNDDIAGAMVIGRDGFVVTSRSLVIPASSQPAAGFDARERQYFLKTTQTRAAVGPTPTRRASSPPRPSLPPSPYRCSTAAVKWRAWWPPR